MRGGEGRREGKEGRKGISLTDSMCVCVCEVFALTFSVTFIL